MRRVTFAVFFALLFLGHYSHAQSVSGGCFFIGGQVMDQFGCSTIVVLPSSLNGTSAFGGAAGISSLLGTSFEASGEVTGFPGGPLSSPCQIFDYGASGAPIRFGGYVAPGVYQLTVTFTACGPPPLDTYGPWIGYATVLLLPPNPATAPPPPTCSALLIDPVQSGLL
jgi:hypothetical protein